MEVNLKALKFSANEKLNVFVQKRVSRLSKFFDSAAQSADVILEEVKEGHKAKIQIHIPGETLVIERTADTFEKAVNLCADAMQERLTRAKEKKNDK